MTRFLLPLAILYIGFTVFAVVDAALIDRTRVRGLPKGGWIAVIVLIPLVGAVLWFAVGRVRLSDAGTVRRSRVVAPDDDPAFLRGLGREKELEDRIEQLEKELRELGDDDPQH
jgi:hypothetical protein